VIGAPGPFSGGKTTLLAVAAARMAEQYWCSEHEQAGGDPSGYERGQRREDRTRLLWSAASRIDRNLFSMPNRSEFWAALSTRETPKDYDRRPPERPQRRNRVR
jgi:hypothetical protein